MKLYLMRHGETDWNKQHLAQGHSDIPLNDTGRSQALAAKTQLGDVDFDICISSPLRRAKETAEIVVDGRCKIIENDLLKERFLGDFEGKPSEQLKSLKDDWDIQLNLSIGNMEPIRDVLNRASMFLDWLRTQNYDKVLISSHGAFLKILYFTIVGYDATTDLSSWHLDNAEIVEIEI